MTVPFVDLGLQYRHLKSEMDAAIDAVCEKSAYIMGPDLRAFERSFADYVGVRHCIAVSSGTDALELALRACGIGRGDEVITVPNTFIATTEAISHAGATIRWVDVEPNTYNMSAELLEQAITPRTKAIIPVHLYGQPASMAKISAIAGARGIDVIEDCAQAHGATFGGRMVGTFGKASCFSFYPGKNLGAYGDGGAVVTNDEQVADQLRLLRDHGQREKYVHIVEGYCRRLDNLQAAVLNVKLPHLNDWNKGRRRAAALYNKLLADTPAVRTPFVAQEAEAVFHLYVIQLRERDKVRELLGQQGVQTGLHYPIALHQQPAYAAMGHSDADFPVSAALAANCLSLPMFAEISDEQVTSVVQALKEAIQQVGGLSPFAGV